MHDSTHTISILSHHIDGLVAFPGCTVGLLGFPETNLHINPGRNFMIGVAECADDDVPVPENELKQYALIYGAPEEASPIASESFRHCNARVAFSFVDYCVEEHFRYNRFMGIPNELNCTEKAQAAIRRARGLTGPPALLTTKRIFPTKSNRERRAIQAVHQRSLDWEEITVINDVGKVFDKNDLDITHALAFKANLAETSSGIVISPEYKAGESSGWAMAAFEEDACHIIQYYPNIYDAVSGLAFMERVFIEPHMEDKHQAAANEDHPQHFSTYPIHLDKRSLRLDQIQP